ncbi:SusC/RagA family TonB-linked outer membrane protein [Bacteroidia bacterium]|nr:SusC/RagA family TonB-linked outer membrane protein [Bacteroidia bacterium]
MRRLLFAACCVCVGTFSLFAQQDVTVTGVITDENGDPMPGATVMVQGGTKGAITDGNGAFSISVKPADVLKISFVGYQTVTVAVADQRKIDVQLNPSANELDEVTIVAFGKQKKESVISSISTVNVKDLKVPSSNLTTALAGRIAGLISYQRSGEPGSDDASFFVRGVTSFTYASGPLILIDGVEMTSSDLARLQPDDIASFSIMKDAAATALYGARGANGVILVTTNEGKEGPASISFRYETSIASPTRNIKLADPITYMKLNNEAVRTRNPLGIQPYSFEKIEKTAQGANPMVYPTNDWYDLLFKNQAINQRVNFNVSGGGTTARYYIAGTVNHDQGVLNTVKDSDNNIDLKRYLLRSNININITNTTEAVVRLHGTFDDYSGPLDSGSGLYSEVLRSDPVAFPAYYIPDEANRSKTHILFGNTGNGTYINPYADMLKGHKSYSKSLMLAQFELKQKLDFITPGLNARALFSTNRYAYFDLSRYYTPYYYTIGSYDKQTDKYTLSALNPDKGSEWLAYKEGDKTVNTTTYFEGAVNYDRVFKEKHNLSGLLVFQLRNYQSGNAGTLLVSLPNRNVGLSGRFTYNYNDCYFIETNFGYNGSEKFSKKERFGFFPSIGGAWLISNESFYNSLDIKNTVNKLKLKLTYGLAGNDRIGDEKDRFFYQSNVNVSDPNRAYTWGESYGYKVNGVTISRYANDKITWEVSRKMNVGLEATLFKSLDIYVDYYTENRSNILMTRSFVPASMGLVVTPQANVGKASGRGIDLSADYNHSFNKDFWITGKANFTYAKAKYDVYEEVDNTMTPWLSHIGMPVSQQWGYVAERLFVDDEEVANSPAQSFGEPIKGGDIKYKDINKDGRITDLDKVPIGYPTRPEIIYGFGLSTGYKNLDFSFFFQGLARESFWIDAVNTSPFLDTDDVAETISKNALLQVYADNHWSENNRNVNALWPRLSDTKITNNGQTSTWWMRDGSFMRLKSVELGYTFLKEKTRKIHVRNLRLYFSGTNLLTFSKFKLWDPEMAGDGMGYPIQRVFNIGLNLTF